MAGRRHWHDSDDPGPLATRRQLVNVSGSSFPGTRREVKLSSASAQAQAVSGRDRDAVTGAGDRDGARAGLPVPRTSGSESDPESCGRGAAASVTVTLDTLQVLNTGDWTRAGIPPSSIEPPGPRLRPGAGAGANVRWASGW
jgi:hypothetical protein